jgi:hypothetical protein
VDRQNYASVVASLLKEIPTEFSAASQAAVASCRSVVTREEAAVTLTKRHGIRAIITLATVGVSSALVACGGSEASGNDAQANAEDAGLNFAKCMREHGVDMPDPQPGGGGQGFNLQFRGGDPRTDDDFQKAQEACGHFLRDAIPEGDRPDPA